MSHYALSDGLRTKFEMRCLDTLIPKAKAGDVLVSEFTGKEQKSEALNWLTIFSQWSLQQGLSADHTLELASSHIKLKHNRRRIFTWTDFVRQFFKDFNVGDGEYRFLQWYWAKAARTRLTWFSYKELKTETDDFSENRIVGQGKVKAVYQGFLLTDVQPVVVKKLKDPQVHSLEDVLYEVSLYHTLPKSPRFVRLLGYSSCEQDPLLVYEYVGNGNLEQHLQGQMETRLSWNERMTIAIDVADAITDLQNNAKYPIYHRAIKCSNILLDEDCRGKLSDFGIAAAVSHGKHRSYCQTKVKGCRGYTDPHYERTGQLSDTTDVYSFGIVLMELVTGLKASLETRSKTFLPSVVIEMSALNLVADIVDSFIWSSPNDDSSKVPCDECLKPVIEEVIHLALRCCHPDPLSRPKIKDVADMLRRVKLEQFCLKKPKSDPKKLDLARLSHSKARPSISKDRPSSSKERRDPECAKFVEEPTEAEYVPISDNHVESHNSDPPRVAVPSVKHFSPLINLVRKFFRLVSSLRPPSYSLCRKKTNTA